MSATGTPGTGSSPRGSCAASSATVVIPPTRRPTATSPRTTRLTSCARVSSASHVGHHGQWRHSVIRDGWARAGAPDTAARRDGHPIGDAHVVLAEGGPPAGPVLGPQVVPDHDIEIEPDHAAPLAVGGAPGGRPSGRIQEAVQMGQPQQVARMRPDAPPRIGGGRAGPRLRERRRDGALAGIGDPVAHHDERHVPALGQAHQQIGPAAPEAGRGRQQRPGDQHRPLGDALGGGRHPLLRRDRLGNDETAGIPRDGGHDRAPMPGRIRAALLERGIGQGAGQLLGRRVVIEVDAPTAARQIVDIERHATRAEGGGLLDRGHT